MLTVRVENWFFRGVWTISQLIYEAVMLVNFAILYLGAMTRDSRCDGVSVWMWGCWNIVQPGRQPPLPLRRHHSLPWTERQWPILNIFCAYRWKSRTGGITNWGKLFQTQENSESSTLENSIPRPEKTSVHGSGKPSILGSGKHCFLGTGTSRSAGSEKRWSWP